MFKYENGEVIGNTKNTYGVCPNCDSDDLDYDVMETDTAYNGMASSQKCTCKHCGFEFTEWYRMVYDGFTTDAEHHNYSFEPDGELT